MEYHRTLGEDFESGFELHFNKACAEIALSNVQDAVESVRKARELCVSALSEEGSSEEEIAVECAAVNMQAAFLRMLIGETAGAAELCKQILKTCRGDLELTAVATNNLAVLRGGRDLPDSLRRFRTAITAAAEDKLTPYQLSEIRFNRCVLLLHMRKVDECLRALDELQKK